MNFSKLFVIIIFVITINIIDAQNIVNEDYKVLFVGNSLTEYKKNKMPMILKTFLKEKNEHINIDIFAKDGFSLVDHYFSIWKNKRRATSSVPSKGESTLVKMIKNGHYKKVIIQERGNLVLKSYYRNKWFYPIIDSIYTKVNKYNGHLLVFEDIGIDFIPPKQICGSEFYYDSLITDCSAIYTSVKQNYDTLEFIYNQINNKNITLVPIPKIMLEYKKTNSKIQLINKSGHPTVELQYMIAAIFYCELTRNNPISLTYNYKLKEEKAEEIRRMVWSFYSDMSR